MLISSTTTITFSLPEDEAAHQAFIKTMSDDWVLVGNISGGVSYRISTPYYSLKKLFSMEEDDDRS